MPSIITAQAPDFKSFAVTKDNSIEEFSLSSLRGKYVILFFYPLDFSFVCPTEILAFDEKMDEFHKRDAEVVGVSVDSVYTHLAWKRTPPEAGGIGPIGYTLVSDLKKDIANRYDVLLQDGMALRALFLIDRSGKIRHAVLNDLPLGRSVDEALRMLDALRFHDERGDLCPANWKEGDIGMAATSQGAIDYLSKFAKK